MCLLTERAPRTPTRFSDGEKNYGLQSRVNGPSAASWLCPLSYEEEMSDNMMFAQEWNRKMSPGGWVGKEVAVEMELKVQRLRW